MGYLNPLVVTKLLAHILLLPEVKQDISKWRAAWSAEELPPQELDVDFVGAVFFDSGVEEPLLAEDQRQRAADPALFQLVYFNPDKPGLDVETFDDLAAAMDKLEGLGPDEIGDGGGIVVHRKGIVAERLFLKYMRKEDYVEYLKRAAAASVVAPPPQEGGPEHAEAVEQALRSRLRDLTRLAPKIGELKRAYESKHLAEPEVVHGRPSEALIEFAKLFPEYLCLGGCEDVS